MYDHRVGFHRCVVRVWYNPSGSAVVACLNAAARTRRAERAVQGDILSVWQVLHGTPSAPLISAQRGARFDDHCTSNVFINNKLRQRYSRFMRSVFHMLSRNEVYRELGANYFDERRRQFTVDRLTRRIEHLGYRVHLEPVAASAA